jgi:hypothetical protein
MVDWVEEVWAISVDWNRLPCTHHREVKRWPSTLIAIGNI